MFTGVAEYSCICEESRIEPCVAPEKAACHKSLFTTLFTYAVEFPNIYKYTLSCKIGDITL